MTMYSNSKADLLNKAFCTYTKENFLKFMNKNKYKLTTTIFANELNKAPKMVITFLLAFKDDAGFYEKIAYVFENQIYKTDERSKILSSVTSIKDTNLTNIFFSIFNMDMQNNKDKIYLKFLHNYTYFSSIEKFQTELYNIEEILSNVLKCSKKEEVLEFYKYFSVFYEEEFKEIHSKSLNDILRLKIPENILEQNLIFLKSMFNNDEKNDLNLKTLLQTNSLKFINKLIENTSIFNKLNLKIEIEVFNLIYQKMKDEESQAVIFLKNLFFEAYAQEIEVAKIFKEALLHKDLALLKKIVIICSKLELDVFDVFDNAFEFIKYEKRVQNKTFYIEDILKIFEALDSNDRVNLFDHMLKQISKRNIFECDYIGVIINFSNDKEKFIKVLKVILQKEDVEVPGIYKFKYDFEYKKAIKRRILYEKIKLDKRYDQYMYYKYLLEYLTLEER